MELALWVAEPFSCIFSFPFGCFGENFHPFQLQFFIFCTEIYSLLGLAKLKDVLHFKLLTRTWKTDFVSRQRNGTWTPSILKEEERAYVNTQHQIILKTGGAGARCPTPTAWLPGTCLPPSASGGSCTTAPREAVPPCVPLTGTYPVLHSKSDVPAHAATPHQVSAVGIQQFTRLTMTDNCVPLPVLRQVLLQTPAQISPLGPLGHVQMHACADTLK